MSIMPDIETHAERSREAQVELALTRTEAPSPPAKRPALTPAEMLSLAIERDASLEMVDKLITLMERTEAIEARREFEMAMAAAKSAMPVVFKNRQVRYDNTAYAYEDMGEIARTIDPILSAHGLSYRYRSEQDDKGLTVTCIITHKRGHYSEVSLRAGADSSGKKNAIQAIGSTVTYLQRYTLKLALGLSASTDDDGRAAGNGDDAITAEQAVELSRMAEEVGADMPKFLRYLKVESLESIPVSRYAAAVAALNAKRATVQS